jgi:hypothetical protein
MTRVALFSSTSYKVSHPRGAILQSRSFTGDLVGPWSIPQQALGGTCFWGLSLLIGRLRSSSQVTHTDCISQVLLPEASFILHTSCKGSAETLSLPKNFGFFYQSLVFSHPVWHLVYTGLSKLSRAICLWASSVSHLGTCHKC